MQHKTGLNRAFGLALAAVALTMAMMATSYAASNDKGCPNTSTKQGVYAPCVGYLPAGASMGTPAVGVHHLAVEPNVLQKPPTVQQVYALGLLPHSLSVPTFGAIGAISLTGGAGQQNPTSPPPSPPYCPCGVSGGYSWSGWDNPGWVGGYSCNACPPPPPPPSSPIDCSAGCRLTITGAVCNASSCIIGNGQVVAIGTNGWYPTLTDTAVYNTGAAAIYQSITQAAQITGAINASTSQVLAGQANTNHTALVVQGNSQATLQAQQAVLGSYLTGSGQLALNTLNNVTASINNQLGTSNFVPNVTGNATNVTGPAVGIP